MNSEKLYRKIKNCITIFQKWKKNIVHKYEKMMYIQQIGDTMSKNTKSKQKSNVLYKKIK